MTIEIPLQGTYTVYQSFPSSGRVLSIQPSCIEYPSLLSRLSTGFLTRDQIRSILEYPYASYLRQATTWPPCFLLFILPCASATIACVYWTTNTNQPIWRASWSDDANRGSTNWSLDLERTAPVYYFHKLFSLLSIYRVIWAYEQRLRTKSFSRCKLLGNNGKTPCRHCNMHCGSTLRIESEQ